MNETQIKTISNEQISKPETGFGVEFIRPAESIDGISFPDDRQVVRAMAATPGEAIQVAQNVEPEGREFRTLPFAEVKELLNTTDHEWAIGDVIKLAELEGKEVDLSLAKENGTLGLQVVEIDGTAYSATADGNNVRYLRGLPGREAHNLISDLETHYVDPQLQIAINKAVKSVGGPDRDFAEGQTSGNYSGPPAGHPDWKVLDATLYEVPVTPGQPEHDLLSAARKLGHEIVDAISPFNNLGHNEEGRQLETESPRRESNEIPEYQQDREYLEQAQLETAAAQREAYEIQEHQANEKTRLSVQKLGPEVESLDHDIGYDL